MCVTENFLHLLLDWKRCSSSQSYPFSDIYFVSFAPFVPSVPLVPSKFSKFSDGVSTRFSAACVATTRHLVRDLIGLFLLLSAVSQSILIAHMRICSTSRRLINFECCRVCPWISMQSSRRETRCTSCQRCCDPFRLFFRVPRFKGTGQSQRVRLFCFRMKRR